MGECSGARRGSRRFHRPEESARRMLPGFPGNPERIEFGRRARLAGIGDKHRFPAALEEPCRSHSTSCHSHHNNHLNFNVDRLSSAKISAAIQNRMITFDSIQPISSK